MKKGFTILEILFCLVIGVIIFSCVVPSIALELKRDKNVASRFVFPMINSSDNISRVHGVNVTPFITYWNDSTAPVAFAATAANATEIGSSGWYNLTLNTSELNHDYIAVELNGTSCLPNGLLINTRSSGSNGTTAADVWSYGTRTLSTSPPAASDIWGYITRTITGGHADTVSTVTNVTSVITPANNSINATTQPDLWKVIKSSR